LTGRGTRPTGYYYNKGSSAWVWPRSWPGAPCAVQLLAFLHRLRPTRCDDGRPEPARRTRSPLTGEGPGRRCGWDDAAAPGPLDWRNTGVIVTIIQAKDTGVALRYPECVQSALRRTIRSRRFIESVILIFAAGSVFYAFLHFIESFDWDFVDWTNFYYRAASSVAEPYDIAGTGALANPPWLFWLLYPFSFLPSTVGLALWMVLSILCAAWCITRLGGDLYIAVLALASPAFVRLFVQGQIDVLVLLGLTLIVTSQSTLWKTAGYVLMTIKPNVLFLGAIVGWLKLRLPEKLIVFTTVFGLVTVSLLVHGFWPRRVYENVTTLMLPSHTGIRTWPYLAPVGVVLLIWSLKREDERVAALATFFLVPYVGLHSLFPYVAVLFTTIPKLWSTAVFILLWILAVVFT
jgi:hypothetical protein